ncbi:hypothetical protein SAMN02745216_02673 [Desulfatibacillum alkenivorans DSM 16219]|jgi:hypothetical protein|uniref:Uracil DNA glycosylase superfamily protein n=1 Tax=Desulfatibacillum alkenivorans DSM 16219 TaxID=1121393 RepID=A0A1M6NW06_9BACT|nr:hypothetical protein [Desulfatibacillum alkenivorans]SHJ99811.1 hypothetical protein SAMN02745216_02673 [Desulfatibacillum alkenivorans DSM 16219]
MSKLFPIHGKIKCSRCFEGAPVQWGKTFIESNGWTLENNPGAWGSRNPEILILGYSKGDRQAKKILSIPFDEIPFKGMRNNLTRILQKLGILSLGESIDQRIHGEENELAFGSLIRCSLGLWDSGKGAVRKSGGLIKASFREEPARQYIRNCSNEYLFNLPTRLKLILMMGNGDDYIGDCFNMMAEIHPEIKRINEVAYSNGAVIWVHLVHPSGAGMSHIKAWLEADNGKQAEKRKAAIEAVRSIGIG